MVRRILSMLILALWAGGGLCAAQTAAFGPDDSMERLVKLDTRLQPDSARPGEHVRMVTTARVKRGWHIYSLQPQGEFGPAPTVLKTLATGFELTGPPYETNPTHERDLAFGLDLWFHASHARFYQNLTVSADTAPGVRSVEQQIRYQTCNDRFCTPPRTEKLTASLTVEPGAVRPEFAAMVRTVDFLDSSGEFHADADSLEGALSGGLSNFLWLAVGFGLLALLTPCVFPMVPVTVTFFTAQTRHGRGVGLAVLFGLGLILSYTGLGLGMTFFLGATGVGQFATSPWVNLVVAMFFIFFAFALLGWVTPGLPAGTVQRLDRGASRIQGPLGVLLMGVAFTAANFTCTMPFVGTLLLAAAGGQLIWPLVGMLVFSTVFALPFVALAMFPQLLIKLRGRSGPWLTQLKVVLGLIEFGAALKFLSNADVIWGWGIVDRELLLASWSAISVACGLMLIFGGWRRPVAGETRLAARAAQWLRNRFTSTDRRRASGVWALPGLAFLGLGLYLAWGVAGGELDAYTEAYVPPRVYRAATYINPPVGDETVARLPWNRSLDQALVLASHTGKPVFIDFTGYTCVNCRWMEKKIFAQGPVLSSLRDQFVLLKLYTDGGPDGETNQRLQVDRFRTLALPFYVILAPDNALLATHAGILPSVTGFQEFLAQGTRVQASTPAKMASAPTLPAQGPKGG